eukprot:GHVQ01006908.1.p2 GENE.GHVQ01006908.1~~GHVQ01006908.1.p2  ORF type:complete len:115 (+),score=9.79 GHVQ01006908.1:110-454(+)
MYMLLLVPLTVTPHTLKLHMHIHVLRTRNAMYVHTCSFVQKPKKSHTSVHIHTTIHTNTHTYTQIHTHTHKYTHYTHIPTTIPTNTHTYTQGMYSKCNIKKTNSYGCCSSLCIH